MAVEKMPVACDLSDIALQDAAHRLGDVPLGECVVSCGGYNGTYARRLQGQLGFELHVVPDCILSSKTAWALWYYGACIWSPGCN